MQVRHPESALKETCGGRGPLELCPSPGAPLPVCPDQPQESQRDMAVEKGASWGAGLNERLLPQPCKGWGNGGSEAHWKDRVTLASGSPDQVRNPSSNQPGSLPSTAMRGPLPHSGGVVFLGPESRGGPRVPVSHGTDPRRLGTDSAPTESPGQGARASSVFCDLKRACPSPRSPRDCGSCRRKS